jgi:FAD/FMN-containing dehydrogenase
MPPDAGPSPAYDAHAARRDRLRAQLGEGAAHAPVGLHKRTSNLFRDRHAPPARRLDVHDLDHVLQVETGAGWVDAEGMTRYETLADACLARGTMPAVVPQLKTITLGGAAAGVGIEATSFREGLVHETLLELDVLTGDGRLVTARPDNEHADLFFGFPNSYGTLGYALRARARTRPVRPFVHVTHRRFDRAEKFFEALRSACEPAPGEPAADFVDGVAFEPDVLVLSTASFVAEAPQVSDYTFERIYYRSLLARDEDWLTAAGYIWRWDTDWFWCSKNLGAQQPLLRRLYGRDRLNSRTYTRLMRLNSRLGLTRLFDRLSGRSRESVIQDVDIPVGAAAQFLEFFQREIRIRPLWICPIGATPAADRFPLYPRTRALYVNFGFWDVVRTRERHEAGHFNRLVERTVAELAGIKSLYSDSYFERDEFRARYGGAAYAALKAKYDPQGRLGDLYDKCVLRR